MRLPLDSFSVGAIPAGRLGALAGLATMLLAVDILPERIIGNPDPIQFSLCAAIAVVSLTLSLNDRMTPAQWVALRNRVTLAAGTLAISIVAAEFGARFAFRDVTTSTDNAGFFTRRWLRTGPIQRNAAGFRGPAFAATKRPGIYRVAVVGDSFTFGNGIRQQDRYTELLQARLPSRIEILNFGEGGANTPQHAKRVEELVGTISPDFILLQWYVNDMEDDDVTGRPSFRPLIPPLHDWLDSRSALYSVANMKWGEMQVRLGWSRSYADYLNERLLNPRSHDAQEDARLLQGLIDSSKKAGVEIGMVLFPDMAAPLDGNYPFGYLHDRVLARCERNKLTCVDLREDFALVKDHRQLWANRFDHHPSARANEIAAERILATFAAKWASSPSR